MKKAEVHIQAELERSAHERKVRGPVCRSRPTGRRGENFTGRRRFLPCFGSAQSGGRATFFAAMGKPGKMLKWLLTLVVAIFCWASSRRTWRASSVSPVAGDFAFRFRGRNYVFPVATTIIFSLLPGCSPGSFRPV